MLYQDSFFHDVLFCVVFPVEDVECVDFKSFHFLFQSFTYHNLCFFME